MKVFRVITIMTASLLLTFLVFFTVLKVTLFNENYLIQMADKSHYDEEVAREINQSVQKIGLGSGIPKETMKNLVSAGEVKESVNEYFRFIYGTGKRNVEAVSQKVARKAEQRMKDYAASQGMTIVSDTKNQFPQLVREVYTKSVELPYMSSFGQRVSSYEKYLVMGMVASGVLLGVMLLILCLIQTRIKHRFVRQVAYIFSSAGLMFVIFPLVVLKSGVVSRVGLTTKSLYDLFTTYVNTSLSKFLLAGGACIAVSVVLAVFSELRRGSLVRKAEEARRQSDLLDLDIEAGN